MSDAPLDPRWPRLLVAARIFRAGLIPRASTATQGAISTLLAAIEAFDNEEEAMTHVPTATTPGEPS